MKQNIPEIFLEIIENDRKIIELHEKLDKVVTVEEWHELQELKTLKKDLIRVAEQTLKWNHNKGNVT